MLNFGTVKTVALAVAFASAGHASFAQDAQSTDCSNAANKDAAECVALNGLPAGDVQNVVFAIAPLLGALGVFAAAAGGPAATTPSTPSN
jgi:hypothetical protein